MNLQIIALEAMPVLAVDERHSVRVVGLRGYMHLAVNERRRLVVSAVFPGGLTANDLDSAKATLP